MKMVIAGMLGDPAKRAGKARGGNSQKRATEKSGGHSEV